MLMEIYSDIAVDWSSEELIALTGWVEWNLRHWMDKRTKSLLAVPSGSDCMFRLMEGPANEPPCYADERSWTSDEAYEAGRIELMLSNGVSSGSWLIVLSSSDSSSHSSEKLPTGLFVRAPCECGIAGVEIASGQQIQQLQHLPVRLPEIPLHRNCSAQDSR